MIRRPPRSTLFPYRRSSDLSGAPGRCPLLLLRVRPPGRRPRAPPHRPPPRRPVRDRKSTRLNSSHSQISYAVFCLKKKKTTAVGGCDPQAVRLAALVDRVTE